MNDNTALIYLKKRDETYLKKSHIPPYFKGSDPCLTDILNYGP